MRSLLVITVLTLFVSYGLVQAQLELTPQMEAMIRTQQDSPAHDGILETAERVTVVGNNLTCSLDAKGRAVTIMGDGNHLTFTGSSASLTVVGSHNEIEVENVKAIIVNGGGNEVNYSGQDDPSIEQESDGPPDNDNPC